MKNKPLRFTEGEKPEEDALLSFYLEVREAASAPQRNAATNISHLRGSPCR